MSGETRIAELEKGVLAAIRLASRLPCPTECMGGDLCACGRQNLVRFLMDLRRGQITGGVDIATASDLDAAVASLEALVIDERRLRDAAELRAHALELELGAAQEAARELGFAHLRDDPPPPRALAYATSLPKTEPSLPPADATPGEG